MSSFQTLINSLDSDNLKRGKEFEHFVKWFLKHDPAWQTQVDEVWLGHEFPDNWGKDKGVDLFFKHKDGEIWAVQAKCYAPEYSVTKSDMDKFLSESNRSIIDKRLLIATTDNIGINAREVCEAQHNKPVTFYLLSDFSKAAIEYPKSLAELRHAKRKDQPKPRPHQMTAIKDVVKGFKDASRGQMIMACGTGKTFTTLWIKEKLEAKTTLVLLPSLSLLSQTLWEWTFASNTQFEALCVCSDETVGKNQDTDSLVSSLQDVSFPTTSNPDDIKKFLKRDVNKVVFSTYHSSPLIAEAQNNSNMPKFDLAIADEAHRCTGEIGKDFTTILDHSLIKANKRLFTTATTRVYSVNMKKRHSEMGVDIADMSNELFFGKEFHNLSFPQAIEKDLLTDYRVVIVGVDEPMIADWIDRRLLVRTEKNDATDAETLASQVGLIKAIKDYDLTRMISFHSRVKKAELFASELHEAIDVVSEKHRPKGELYTDYVSGKMVSSIRKQKLTKLKTLHDADRGILTNARCLSEGIDVPSLDGIAFIDPRSSQVDIIQAVGRAIRKSDKKNFGTIVLPVFIEEHDDSEKTIQSSRFKPIWDILNALKSHDETLSLELGQIRTSLGHQSHSGLESIDIPDKIIFDLPTKIDNSFADSLKTVLIEKTTDSWDFWFGLLQKFVDEEGHTRTGDTFTTPSGHKLGMWLSNQRNMIKNDLLSNERKEKLESLQGWILDIYEYLWEEGFMHLKNFVKENGHANPKGDHINIDEYRLGQWVLKNRVQKKKSKLDEKYIERLEALKGWVWDVDEENWNKAYEYLVAFVKKYGHARPRGDYITPDKFALGQWVSHRRRNKLKNELSVDRIKKLEALDGWVWDALEFQWNQGFKYLVEFVNENGHARPKHNFKTLDKYPLFKWCSEQKTLKAKDKLSEVRINKLEALNGWIWGSKLDLEWDTSYSYLKAFVKENGHARPKATHKTSDGKALGSWVASQRQRKKLNKLSSERIKKLEALEGWVWDVMDYFYKLDYSYLQEFIKENGHAMPKATHKTSDGYPLGNKVQKIRGLKKKGKLEDKYIKKFESLEGWAWEIGKGKTTK